MFILMCVCVCIQEVVLQFSCNMKFEVPTAVFSSSYILEALNEVS